ncbi:MAG: nitrous oxide reductase accessory protein NosL [Myxococcota bacterium]
MTRLLLLGLFVLACGDAPAAERCARCGMLVGTAPAWLSGLGDTRFDSPKCLLRWRAEQGREGGWVTEYYSSERREIERILFVVGSDVISPMGDDLVPVENRVQADVFVRDHGGRVIAPGEVDAATLASLDP